ncbi:hypothetical protein J437_LFUL018554 [Ladona fulva]|uniref:Endonuclease/exonuclease/phosphatase domain-containing protein n=1 Tax=Ladona fulva TaxID=123851 RepID=A0A8K0KVY3_LADFU|nr:hypothetical protein J437_LFUL018554 [Ladona fulva]
MRSLQRSSGTKQDAMQSIIMKILQGNMNKSRIADALLPQLSLEQEADILLPLQGHGARTELQNEVCPKPTKRGRLILEMAARMDLIVLNIGNMPTYRRPGFGNSIPDLSLASENIAAITEEWRVIEDYTGRDHQYITFKIGREMQNRTDHHNKIPHHWNYRKFDEVKFAEKLLSGIGDIPETSQIVKRREVAEDVVSSTMKILKCASDSSMPIIKRFTNRNYAYWWTLEIAELRRNCLKLRRKAQRARIETKGIDYSSEHKSARKEL